MFFLCCGSRPQPGISRVEKKPDVTAPALALGVQDARSPAPKPGPETEHLPPTKQESRVTFPAPSAEPTPEAGKGAHLEQDDRAAANGNQPVEGRREGSSCRASLVTDIDFMKQLTAQLQVLEDEQLDDASSHSEECDFSIGAVPCKTAAEQEQKTADSASSQVAATGKASLASEETAAPPPETSGSAAEASDLLRMSRFISTAGAVTATRKSLDVTTDSESDAEQAPGATGEPESGNVIKAEATVRDDLAHFLS
eukprot:TRINITY_DN58767_c0_g1_i1.p1 TRINITY_DN58767_c0_g1~~TRINITY_DN58767_c0_g1_i1.p1  ORF type:complete len:255 (-),score=48.94 TRINITY_DN58767_c0_g1_i1:197-961(-)